MNGTDTTTTAPAATTDPEAEKRAAYTAGLRALADLLDADPELPLPYYGTSAHVAQFPVFTQTKAQVVKFARQFHGKSDKAVTDGAYGFELTGTLHGLHMLIYAPRTEVCERVIVGTREVTEEVPDPEALAAVPTVTVTKTVEDVRWDCKPLLADA